MDGPKIIFKFHEPKLSTHNYEYTDQRRNFNFESGQIWNNHSGMFWQCILLWFTFIGTQLVDSIGYLEKFFKKSASRRSIFIFTDVPIHTKISFTRHSALKSRKKSAAKNSWNNFSQKNLQKRAISWENALFATKAKFNVFWNYFK